MARVVKFIERLRAVNGVGLITAISCVLGIEDPHRFATSRSVGAFLGLRPRQWQSGDREKELGTPRLGDRELRRVQHKARLNEAPTQVPKAELQEERDAILTLWQAVFPEAATGLNSP